MNEDTKGALIEAGIKGFGCLLLLVLLAGAVYVGVNYIWPFVDDHVLMNSHVADFDIHTLNDHATVVTSLKYAGKTTLRDVKITLMVSFTDKTGAQTECRFGEWKPGEVKEVVLPTHGKAVMGAGFTGTARRDNKEVSVFAAGKLQPERAPK